MQLGPIHETAEWAAQSNEKHNQEGTWWRGARLFLPVLFKNGASIRAPPLNPPVPLLLPSGRSSGRCSSWWTSITRCGSTQVHQYWKGGHKCGHVWRRHASIMVSTGKVGARGMLDISLNVSRN